MILLILPATFLLHLKQENKMCKEMVESAIFIFKKFKIHLFEEVGCSVGQFGVVVHLHDGIEEKGR